VEPEGLERSVEAVQGPPLIEPGHTYASVTDKISSIVLGRRTPRHTAFCASSWNLMARL